MTAAIRVLVVEQRGRARARLVRALEADGDVTVVGECDGDGDALAAVQRLRPDLVAVAGGADGPAIDVVEAIMAYAPTPLIVVKRGGPTDDAPELAAGAVGVVPWSDDPATDAALRRRVRMLRSIVVVRHPRARLRPRPTSRPASTTRCGGAVIGMAASTGGPHSLAAVLTDLGDVDAPVLVVQHIHPDFVDGLAGWLTLATGRRTTLATDGAVPEPGAVYVAPGGLHLTVSARGRMALRATPAVLHTPSANELFASMASSLGGRAVGVLLTGMGDDGAAGLLGIHRAGGATIVQDSASATVDGMPRAARDLGAAGVVAPLDRIADAVLAAVEERS